MYKQILVALDDSPRAPEVLRHAAELAARDGATLHLCRAVNVPVGIPLDAWMLAGDELAQRLLDHAKEELAALTKVLLPLKTPIVWGRRVCHLGVPAQVVVELADELHADLVVIGSHGYNAFERVLGTTAARIVNHARCSVLVVRAAPAASPEAA